MGYWEDYNHGQTGNPLGKPWSRGYIDGENDRRRREWNGDGNGNGGGNGCGYIILFFVVIQILLAALPIIIPATISAFLVAIILNIFGNQILSVSVSPSFGKAFKWIFYTYLWYIPVLIVVGVTIFFTLLGLGFSMEATKIMDLFNTEVEGFDHNTTAFYKLGFIILVFQIPFFLIAGAFFKHYVDRGFEFKVSYWRLTTVISSALIIWFVITGIEYYLWTKYSPETFQYITKIYQEILK